MVSSRSTTKRASLLVELRLGPPRWRTVATKFVSALPNTALAPGSRTGSRRSTVTNSWSSTRTWRARVHALRSPGLPKDPRRARAVERKQAPNSTYAESRPHLPKRVAETRPGGAVPRSAPSRISLARGDAVRPARCHFCRLRACIVPVRKAIDLAQMPSTEVGGPHLGGQGTMKSDVPRHQDSDLFERACSQARQYC